MKSLTKNHTGEICVVCEQSKKNGIHLYTRFICKDCEAEIISTDTGDERYRFYLRQLKKVLHPEQFS